MDTGLSSEQTESTTTLQDTTTETMEPTTTQDSTIPDVFIRSDAIEEDKAALVKGKGQILCSPKNLIFGCS